MGRVADTPELCCYSERPSRAGEMGWQEVTDLVQFTKRKCSEEEPHAPVLCWGPTNRKAALWKRTSRTQCTQPWMWSSNATLRQRCLMVSWTAWGQLFPPGWGRSSPIFNTVEAFSEILYLFLGYSVQQRPGASRERSVQGH